MPEHDSAQVLIEKEELERLYQVEADAETYSLHIEQVMSRLELTNILCKQHQHDLDQLREDLKKSKQRNKDNLEAWEQGQQTIRSRIQRVYSRCQGEDSQLAQDILGILEEE